MWKVKDLASLVRRRLALVGFRSSEQYWDRRYRLGGNSGGGSYGELARRKANVVNGFVKRNNIRNIIEYGCGDGNQLTLAEYPHYVGYDVSPGAIQLCQGLFKGDPTKAFHLMKDYDGARADLTLSLDVIFHLVEDDVFEKYMRLLFDSSDKFTMIYSTNVDRVSFANPHIKHRRFTEWVKTNMPGWELISHVPSDQSNAANTRASLGKEFFAYQKQGAWIRSGKASRDAGL